MTREEAMELIDYLKDPFSKGYSISIIDGIYDDFESRTCESCRWYQEAYNEINCNSQTINVCKLWDIAFAPDMGCNKWEKK